MPRNSLITELGELLDEPHPPVVDGCTPELAALVSRILDWHPVTVATLVAEGHTEASARTQLAKATALVLKNHGGAVAVASRLMALTAESEPTAVVAASRAFREMSWSAQSESKRLDNVRLKFQKLARSGL